MKVLLLCMTIFAGSTGFISNFYQFSFDTLDDTTVNATVYEGKKVVIAVVGANGYGSAIIQFLDSVQNTHPNLQVIAVPTGDFGSSTAAQDLTALKQNTSIVIAKPIFVKQRNDSLQHPLFRWLTQAAENGHFNGDIEGEGQMFVINAQGELVAVCSKPTRKDVFLDLVKQSIDE